ncbi:hypothetical protein L596_000036 [Steinernema carpocapsae]|uniref:Uncharacterized protein n=1 Tax=Steinernema carpocapsae TaxID=34508 RepID=A0A4U8UJD7_STECR|nr:hypothetical protein L596_000036 [Steinernema carpocapsae]
MSWEMLTVNKLDWNLCAATAMEFFDQFVIRDSEIGSTDRAFCDCIHHMQKNVELATLLPSHQAALALLYVTTKEKSKIEAKARDLVFKSTSLDKNMVSFYATIIDRLRQNDFSDERFTETISAEIIFAHEAELEKEVKTKQLRTPTNSPHGRRSLRVTPNRPCPIVLRTSGSKRRRSEDIRETSCEYVPIASKKLVPSNDDSGISLGILTPESSQPERSQGFISLNRLVPW